MCAEQELVVCNSWFEKNDVYKYPCLRMAERMVVDKALMDYVLLPRRMLGRLRCESLERRRGVCLTIFWWKLGWNYWVAGGVPGGWRVWEMCWRWVNWISVKEMAYQESLRGKYEVWRGGEVESVEKEWEKFRDRVMEWTNDACAMRRVGGQRRKGSSSRIILTEGFLCRNRAFWTLFLQLGV